MVEVKVEHVDFLWAIKRELQKYGDTISRELLGDHYWRLVGSEWEYLHLKKPNAMRTVEKGPA